MPALPAYTRTWTQALTAGTPGVRIVYSSLLSVMRSYLYGVTNFLGANGLTIQFSSNSVTAGAGNNIAAAANWIRGATAGTAQSWMILRDGNGGQLLVAYTGTLDDVGYVSYSPGSLFTGTAATTRPSASDEQILANVVSLIGSTASGDRIWHALVSSDAKAYRWGVMRSLVGGIGYTFGVENFTPSSSFPAWVTINPVYAWGYTGTSFSEPVMIAVSTAGGGGFVRGSIASNTQNMQCNSGVVNAIAAWQSNLPELQGGYTAWPLSLFATSPTVHTGHLGTLIDSYVAPCGATFGDGYGASYEWFFWGAVSGSNAVYLWPNPSNVAPPIS